MKLFNVFKKKNENNSEKPEKTHSNYCFDIHKDIPERYEGYDIMAMSDLASLDHTFWKFTQSIKGRSHEDHFAEYKAGRIESAIDKDEWLSFVDDDHIGNCVGYGDRLTLLNFEPENKDFQLIANEPVIYKNNAFGEYVAKHLLVEEHYSLENPETIAKIIEMSNFKAVRSMFYGFSPIDEVLDKYGFSDSKDFVDFIKDRFSFAYSEDIEDLKDNIYHLLEEWKDQNKTSPLDELDSLQRDEQQISNKIYANEYER